MSNFLLTYSYFPEYGFQNYFYFLEDTIIDIDEVEKYEELVIAIPYDFKNVIEPNCFKDTDSSVPLIIPIRKKVRIEHFNDIARLLNEFNFNDTFYSGNFTSIDFETYNQNFQKIQNYLKAGDIYEMNYCIPFVFENIQIPVGQFFVNTLPATQPPFGALFKFRDDIILSFSPERFLKKEGNYLFTEPIKGTAPRRENIIEDEKMKEQLLKSNKERTENAMIVDVSRNDLSRIAQKGTVKVEELYSIKSYPTVHQMVSKISCVVKENSTFKDIIYATFPMASMTGAPKIRAIQIAEEIEAQPREFYSGCLGIYEKGNFDLSVLIRSVFYNKEKKELKIWVGSAVTIYTNAQSEYEECLLKAEKILQSIEKLRNSKKV